MTRSLLALLVICSIALPIRAADESPHIDIVFCIDCSGSMGGVIETAKMKVWDIVNQVGKAKPAPVLRIGLLGYGNGAAKPRFFDLSDDLDTVYKNLMTFKDEGWGKEYVGLAIDIARREMKWSTDGKNTLKLIYVIGNETAHQGTPDYTKSAPEAIAAGIMINAIYCGTHDKGSAPPTWRELAKLADGQYMEIAGDGGAVVVATPYDAKLAELNGQLNKTYVGYGAAAPAAAQNQAAQDSNAGSFGGSVVAARAVAKSSSQYNNARWDLVDASKEKDFDLSKIKDEELPEDMRKLSAADRKTYIEQKLQERGAVQTEIQKVAAQRDAFIREEISKKGLKSESALDAAVQKSLKEQGEKKGFEFGK